MKIGHSRNRKPSPRDHAVLKSNSGGPCSHCALTRPLSRLREHRATARYPCTTARWHGLLSDQVRSCNVPLRAFNRIPVHTACPHGTSARSRASMSCSQDKSVQLALCKPRNMRYWPPTRARTCASRSRDCAVLLQMARKGKEVATSSTPSRSRTTKNSSRGRDDGFPADRFDSQIYYDRWKTMENRGYTHERIIRLPEGEPNFWHDRIEGLGWGFIIPFTENDIRRYLNINIDLPGQGVNDAFKEATERRNENDLDLGMVFNVIGRQDTNWANNPVDDTIPERKLDNNILNAKATTWHKLIIANVDPR
ncbi:hypothetical protein PIB30_077615 [Stylosanthes scabra]|uniref:Uncharacterized protein n=1 Tax=Stylosanthes scabra TaxID=79078 RepID=A0ABU6TQ65_9FABA|nr:hypothetical protein [Stylosanthes scabra]